MAPFLKRGAGPIVLKNSTRILRQFSFRDLHASASRHFWRRSDQLCEFAEVLRCGSEVEFVSGSVRAAQSQASEAEDALEVGEQPFDLLPSAAALKEGIRSRHGAHLFADGFMRMAGDLSGFLVRRALRL
jgi:hypothetical protein